MLNTRSHYAGAAFVRLFRMLPYLGIVRWLRRRPARLFQIEYYLAGNPDVAASRINPLLHFLLFGGFEGRKPNALFDPEFYLREYGDVAAAAINPLVHYLKYGAAEGRRPHPLFDANQEGGEHSAIPFLRALEEPSESVLYRWWMCQEGRLTPPVPAVQPRISVLLAVSAPRREWLEEAVESVRGQIYPQWELCVCDNAGEAWVADYLARTAETDRRIRLTQAGRLDATVALERAALMATGDYLVVLDAADRLNPNALAWLASKAPADLIYSDEDKLDAGGNRMQPLFKPDWSPDLLLSCMYIGRIMAISRSAWERIGGIHPEFEQAWDYDLALRVIEAGGRVEHVPRILYSRRDVRDTDAQEQDAARRSLLAAVDRRGLAVEVAAGPRPATLRPHWKASGTALVTIIICSRSPQLLERCLGSMAERTAYPNREIIVVQHLDGGKRGLERVIGRYGATRIPYSGPFHFSRMNNLAAGKAQGDILVFLNDDTEILDPSWLERLVGQVERPDVGIAGACLLYPSGRLQHGGVAIGVGDGCAHIGRDSAEPVPHWPWLDLTRDLSAVTGACLAVRASVFREVGGFPEEFPVNYNDIDLCLRVREAGYRVIYEAGAVLRHYECQSRVGVVSGKERHNWCERWGALMDRGDPFYSQNLTQDREDLSFRSR